MNRVCLSQRDLRLVVKAVELYRGNLRNGAHVALVKHGKDSPELQEYEQQISYCSEVLFDLIRQIEV